MKKLLFILFCFIVLTVVFLVIVLVISKDSGRGALQLTSIPKSKAYLNNAYIGETPICRCQLSQMLPIGEYSIKLVPNVSGISEFDQTIQINSGVLSVIDRTFGQGLSGEASVITLDSISDQTNAQLLVISFPDKSNVFLDNNQVGTTPLLLNNLTPSDHEIKVSKDGFRDKIVKIRTVDGFRLETQVFLAINDSQNIASQAASTPPTTLKPVQVQILPTPTGFLRVRLSASLNSSEVGRVNPGEIYDLISQQGNWYEIKLTSGVLGWVSSQYATKK